MIKSLTIKSLLFIAILAFSCKERYDPKLSPEQSNYLVVEGIINAQGITTIRLGRTVPLSDTARIKAETLATVIIEDENLATYFLSETDRGLYKSDDLVLDRGKKYRLHINTRSGGEYLSEFVEVRITPAIDNVTWKQEADGLQIYASTHDDNNNTRYYKWDYEETWEVHSSFPNLLEYADSVVTVRNPAEVSKLFYCWATNNSVSILLGSSAQLTNDVINLAPLNFIPAESEKTSVRYSILVKQYALDRRGYDFYKMMKSNTESLGSVFDPLPSELTGNITCVSNAAEKVIGYVTASTVSEKRIFVERAQIVSKFSAGCITSVVPRDSMPYYNTHEGLLPYDAEAFPPAPVIAYYASSEYCIDCRLRGSSEKPSFW